jgi:hydroxyacylglutathione hydrolase
LIAEAQPLWIMETNAWIIASPETRECIVVDVPPYPAPLLGRMAELRVFPTAIIVTHAHLDHAGGVGALLAALDAPVPVYVDSADRELLLRPRSGGLLAALLPDLHPPPASAVVSLDDDIELTVGATRVTTMPTPGHTPGSTCVVVHADSQPFVLTGDNLFAGGAGRCDLPGSSRRIADLSRQALLAAFGDDVTVLPGHGESTTIGAERPNP